MLGRCDASQRARLVNRVSIDLLSRQHDDPTCTCVALVGHVSGSRSSRVVPSKTHPYAVKCLVDDIGSLGRKKFIFKSDQEPSISILGLEEKKKARASCDDTYQIMFESSPVGDH
eukprot:6569836-Pyramimonas_sp.AAC.1